jgi:HK97 family phage portal protein
MALFKKKPEKRNKSATGILLSDVKEAIECGYIPLTEEPTIVTACERIADLVGQVSWHIMSNTEDGDIRIENELSRKIDIDPNRYLTRQKFIKFIVMTLLLYGDGNAVVKVITEDGYLRDLIPIAGSRVGYIENGSGYWITIDGIPQDPEDLLHFTLYPDKYKPWKGRGIKVSASTVADNLAQAAATEKAFMRSKWKPPLIVKVDALIEEFASPEGRRKLIDEYVGQAEAGEPWIIPAEQFDVQSFKPLTLQDLAIADTVKLNKQTAAAIVGVPPFMVGVGTFNKDEYNNFINSTIRDIVVGMAQELTKKLILSEKWYIRGNVYSLLDWDIQTIANVFTTLQDRGDVTGNEVREKLNMPPKEGLNELRILENYIPTDMSGNQKKLITDTED